MNNIFTKTLIALLLFTSCSDDFDPSVQESKVYSSTKLDNLAIYYGWLNSLNSSSLGWNNTNIINFINQYDSIVLGAGLEDSGHGDYANTTAILAGLDSKVKTFGYVNLGNTNSYSIAQMKSKVDDWVTLNIKGIFLDEAGFDYWGGTDNDMRIRQNEIIDYIHTKNITAILNVWDPDDIFIKEPGTPTTIQTGDYVLYESYQFSTAASLSLTNHLTKINKLIAAKKSHNIKIMAINTTSEVSTNFNQDDLDYMTILAQTEEIDSLGWGTAAFSASGTDNAVMPFRSSTYNKSDLFSSRTVNTGDNTITQIHKSGIFTLDFDNKTFSNTAQ